VNPYRLGPDVDDEPFHREQPAKAPTPMLWAAAGCAVASAGAHIAAGTLRLIDRNGT
jgi:hypothetical protein